MLEINKKIFNLCDEAEKILEPYYSDINKVVFLIVKKCLLHL